MTVLSAGYIGSMGQSWLHDILKVSSLAILMSCDTGLFIRDPVAAGCVKSIRSTRNALSIFHRFFNLSL